MKSEPEKLNNTGNENGSGSDDEKEAAASDSSMKTAKAPKKKGKGKKILFVLALLFALFVIGIVALKTYVEVKAPEFASSKLNGTLTIEKLDIGFKAIEVRGLKIESVKGEKWIGADRVVLKYDLLKILDKPTGQKAVKSLDVYGLYVLLESKPGGGWNLSDLSLGKKKKKKLKLAIDAPINLHDGTFIFRDITFEGMDKTAYPINGTISLRSGMGALVDLGLKVKDTPASLDVKGKIYPSMQGGYVRVNAKNLDAAIWGNYFAHLDSVKILKGYVDVEGDISSEKVVDTYDAVGSIDYNIRAFPRDAVIHTTVLPDDVSISSGEVTVARQIVKIENLKAEYQGADLDVEGKIVGFDNPTMVLIANSKAVPLENMKKQPVISSLPFPVSGNVKLNLVVNGPVSSTVIKGRVNFDEMTAADEKLEKGEIDFNYYSDTARIILKKLAWKKGSFSGLGYVNLENKNPHFVIDLKGGNADVGTLARKMFPDYKISATSDFDVKVIGTVKNPLVFGSTDFRNVSYDKLSINSGKARFIYTKDDILILDADALLPEGRLFSHGARIDLGRKRLYASLSGRDFNLPRNLSPSLEDVIAKGDFDISLFGRFANPVVTGSFRNTLLNYKGRVFTDTAGSFTYRDSVALISDTSSNMNGRKIDLKGWYQAGSLGGGEFVFNLDDFYLKDIGQFNAYLGTLAPNRSLDAKGYFRIAPGRYQWGVSGDGSLGGIAAFGEYNGNNNHIQNVLVARDLDVSEFLTKDNLAKIQPGRGNAIVISRGSPQLLKNKFRIRLSDGRVLGLPINSARGIVTYSGSNLHFDDVYVGGIVKNHYRDERLRAVAGKYNLTSIWGPEAMAYEPRTKLAKIYYSPYLLKDFLYTRDGWKVNYLTTYSPPSGGLVSPYRKIMGLPDIWPENTWNGTAQLKDADSSEYPMNLNFSRTARTRRESGWFYALDGSVTGTVNLDTGKLNLKVRQGSADLGILEDKLNLESLGVSKAQFEKVKETFQGKDIYGTADFQGLVGGYLDSPSWKGSLKIYNGVMNGEYFALRSDFEASRKKIVIDDMLISRDIGDLDPKKISTVNPDTEKKNGTFYTGKGSIEFKETPVFDLEMTAFRGRLERLLDFTPWRDVPALGWINGKINFRGTIDHPGIEGDVSVSDAEVFGQPIASLDMKFTSEEGRKDKPEKITLEKFTARIDGGIITGSGNMEGDNLDFNVSAGDFPLDELAGVKEYYPQVSGSGNFDARISGTTKAPVADMTFTAKDFSLRGETFNHFEGEVHAEDNQIEFSPVFLEMANTYWIKDWKDSFLEVTGFIRLPDKKNGKKNGKGKADKNGKTSEPHFAFNLNFDNWRLNKILELVTKPVKEEENKGAAAKVMENVDGTVNGKMGVSGSYSAFDLSFEMKVTDGNIGKSNFDVIEGRGSLGRDYVEITDLSLKGKNYEALLTGKYEDFRDQKSLNFTAYAENVPAGMLSALHPSADKLEGRIFVNSKERPARIKGTPDKPDFMANLTLLDGKWNKRDFGTLKGNLEGQKGEINRVTLERPGKKGGQKVDVRGKIPVAIDKGRFVSKDKTDITASIDSNLDILGVFVPLIQNTEGKVTGNVRVTGVFPDFKVKADKPLTLKNGKVKLSFMDLPVEKINAAVRIDGKRMDIDRFDGILRKAEGTIENADDGVFRIKGFAILDDDRVNVEDMKFTLTGQKLDVKIPGLVTGRVDARVTLSGTPEKMVIGPVTGEPGEVISIGWGVDPFSYEDDGKAAGKENLNYVTLSNATLSMPKGRLQNLSQLLPGSKDKKEEQDNSFDFPLPEINNFIINLGSDVWVDYSGLFANSQGQVEINRKSGQSIRVFGILNFVRGSLRLPFVKNVFKLSRGIITFNGGDPVYENVTTDGSTERKIVDYSLNPSLDFEAETASGDSDIYLAYKGTFEQLKQEFSPESNPEDNTGLAGSRSMAENFSLYSIPAMSRSEIMSTLIVGTVTANWLGGDSSGTTSIEGTAVNALGNYMQSLLFTSISKSFGRALSLSRLDLEYNPSGAFSILISKAIDRREKFFLTYSKISDPQRESRDIWGFEYKYRPGMRLRLAYDQSVLVYSLRGQYLFDGVGDLFTQLFRVTDPRNWLPGRNKKKEEKPAEKKEEKKDDEII